MKKIVEAVYTEIDFNGYEGIELPVLANILNSLNNEAIKEGFINGVTLGVIYDYGGNRYYLKGKREETPQEQLDRIKTEKWQTMEEKHERELVRKTKRKV